MRSLHFIIIVFTGLACFAGSAAMATETSSPLASYLAPASAKFTEASAKYMRSSRTLLCSVLPKEMRFCGQCSEDSACGTGWKCCGPSTCRECKNVTTCP